MKRKLVKHGEATMMVSMPSKWIRKNSLLKGDEVNIEETENKLLISLETQKHKKETEINISSLTESSIRTILTNLYRLGYDKITVQFPKENTVHQIENIIRNNLIGFEIIKKGKLTCVIENITEPSEDQFNNIFSKIFLNIEELFEIAEDVLNGKKKEFEHTEKQIKSFDNFCRRVLANKNDNESSLTWTFQAELIHAQREIYLMLKHLSNKKVNPDSKVLHLLDKCKKIFSMLKEAYKKRDISLLEKIHEEEKRLIYKGGYEELKKNDQTITIHHILSAARNFYLASSPLFGIFATK